MAELQLNFNSSVVRLKVKLILGLSIMKLRFQFQCGAIEGPLPQLQENGLISFQFQCGAIEGELFRCGSCYSQGFQFQCGAIEGFMDEGSAEFSYLFQFQCGAIEGDPATPLHHLKF